MKFEPTGLDGAFVIHPEYIRDERGFFARTFCRDKFERMGLDPDLVQCSVSYNRAAGTLRGLHYQASPHAEVKLVRVTQGAVYDVILDLRPQSSTFKHWFAVKLSAQNHIMLYVPEGLAHGFLTLTDDVEVLYQMSQFYYPESARGVRWDDPVFEIAWPSRPKIISERDQEYPDFVEDTALD